MKSRELLSLVAIYVAGVVTSAAFRPGAGMFFLGAAAAILAGSVGLAARRRPRRARRSAGAVARAQASPRPAVVEIDKPRPAPAADPDPLEVDLASALRNLGQPKKGAAATASQVIAANPGASLSQLIAAATSKGVKTA